MLYAERLESSHDHVEVASEEVVPDSLLPLLLGRPLQLEDLERRAPLAELARPVPQDRFWNKDN